MKTILLIILTLLLTGCMNKHGISAKYYSDCKEYYDLQGYYHKECGDDDFVSYKEIKETASYLFGVEKEEKKPKGNVW
ncbi:hypothetical protein M947_03720 [Sulfurimonas hongkongensis]|uniref:Lipoprotein n=1 Tax=Sulfurimonas hongkongensis TaxID=1172190 RepID=T0JT88_9BACT|nr:hypothetical protein [Sulfurimonas hongkongensis]EQB40142.1 hypothetical protein M947_03720 [Sulfurimonas hongkongensis]